MSNGDEEPGWKRRGKVLLFGFAMCVAPAAAVAFSKFMVSLPLVLLMVQT